jgi:hypothetical protein
MKPQGLFITKLSKIQTPQGSQYKMVTLGIPKIHIPIIGVIQKMNK